jgi:hypothetical protein
MGFKDYLNVYEFECELPGTGEKILYKPITTSQIKKLLVYENENNPIKIEEAFDELIKSCVISPKFNIDEIFLEDRYFLLIELRKASKGSVYEFKFSCPKCKSDNLFGVDMDGFKVTKRPKKVDGKMPLSEEISLFITHITRGQQKAAYKDIDAKLPLKQLQAEMALNSVAASISEIETPDGLEKDLKFKDQKYIMDNLSFNIFDDIKKWYDENDFGIDLSYDVKCTHCDFKSKKELLRIDSNFF